MPLCWVVSIVGARCPRKDALLHSIGFLGFLSRCPQGGRLSARTQQQPWWPWKGLPSDEGTTAPPPAVVVTVAHTHTLCLAAAFLSRSLLQGVSVQLCGILSRGGPENCDSRRGPPQFCSPAPPLPHFPACKSGGSPLQLCLGRQAADTTLMAPAGPACRSCSWPSAHRARRFLRPRRQLLITAASAGRAPSCHLWRELEHVSL